MHIRSATPADAERLAALRYDFRATMNQAIEEREGFIERCSAWMAERLQPGGPWHCWVAEQDQIVVGQLWLQLIEKVPNPAPELEQHAYITNVYVDPSARAAGTGQRLLDAALGFCREQRVDSVILWPTERSRTLYARNGFAAPADMLEAVLDTGRDIH
ncbi:MAG TPA: GNAT family N-acetyltransferase [Tepidiformaceae bacterium]|nr:GNAT family N-acetyltransferase [Tepidiformaceae bacterium]